MKLSEENAKLFYKLSWGLLFYVNKKYYIIKELSSPDFRGQKMQDVAKLEEKLFSNPELIDSFIKENPLNFNNEELNILKSWRDLFIKDEFFIFSVNNKIIFLNEKKEAKVYEVLGILDEIKDIIPFEPYLTRAVLLPFNGKIVYSGFLNGYNVSFGGGMKKTLTENFFKAKIKFGVIKTLESYQTEKTESESIEELLRFYLKNQNNRYEYEEEIEKILRENPFLIKIYNQELGKSNARKIKKRLSQLKMNSGWFAVFNNVVVSSGKNKKEVLERANEIVPEDKKEGIFVFKYKNKKEC